MHKDNYNIRMDFCMKATYIVTPYPMREFNHSKLNTDYYFYCRANTKAANYNHSATITITLQTNTVRPNNS